jgi:hypothetical protein
LKKLNKLFSIISGLTLALGFATLPFSFILGYSLAIAGGFVLALMLIDSAWIGDQASAPSYYAAVGPGGSGGEKRLRKSELDQRQE